MADGGLISKFQFVSYKIDQLELKMFNSLDIVEATIFEGQWKIDLSVRTPQFYTSRGYYLGGVSCTLSTVESVDAEGGSQPLCSVKSSIVGVFRVDSKFEDPARERDLVFNQIPAILFPYLRGAITSLLANAGMAGVFIPLINIYAAAKEAIGKRELEVRP